MKATIISFSVTISSVALGFFLSGCGDSSSNSDDAVQPPPIEEPQFAGTITDFLWKPKADEKSRSPGTLAVLASACNAEVRVNGEALIDSGPSNGRCTTARANRSGCLFGANVKVEVIDRATGFPYLFPSGDAFYLVTNGCVREEFR